VVLEKVNTSISENRVHGDGAEKKRKEFSTSSGWRLSLYRFIINYVGGG
jgi:hypothetical protein